MLRKIFIANRIEKFKAIIKKYYHPLCMPRERKLLALNESPLTIGLIAELLSLTILAELCAWLIMELTNGSIWIHGQRMFKQSQMFEPGLDGGYFEHFQYIVLLWCAILVSRLCFKTRWRIWTLVFLYWFLFFHSSLSLPDVFIDNVNQYNPSLVSRTIAGVIRGKDLIEYIYWLSVSTPFAIVAYIEYSRADKRLRNILNLNYQILLLMSFFSILIDTIAANVFRLEPFLSKIIGGGWIYLACNYSFYLLEECGEIVAICILFLYQLYLNANYTKDERGLNE